MCREQERKRMLERWEKEGILIPAVESYRALCEDQRQSEGGRQGWLGLYMTIVTAIAAFVFQWCQRGWIGPLLLWGLFIIALSFLIMTIAQKRSLNAHAKIREWMDCLPIELMVREIHTHEKWCSVFGPYVFAFSALATLILAMALHRSGVNGWLCPLVISGLVFLLLFLCVNIATGRKTTEKGYEDIRIAFLGALRRQDSKGKGSE